MSLCFLLFSIAITSFRKNRAGLCAFRAFVCFARVSLCLFPLPIGDRDWLRFMTVALPGHFPLPSLDCSLSRPTKSRHVFAWCGAHIIKECGGIHYRLVNMMIIKKQKLVNELE